MRVGVIQSNYIPWRGYFDFIAGVDLFVFHDDLQYTKGDWRNRNRIKTPAGLIWLSVPVKYHKTAQLICDTEIDYSKRWQRDHLNQFSANYREALYCNSAIELLESAFQANDRTISELNIRLVRAICSRLGISTPMRHSADYAITGTKTERLIDLLKKTGATTYVSGPAAKAYLDEQQFHENGITLEYKTYDYAPYPQVGDAFAGAVSVLDLIANVGPDAKNHIASRSPNLIGAP